MRPARLLISLALSSTLATAPTAGVIVVDEAMGPGAHFEDLQEAVDAAVDGDVILVRDGTYSPCSIQAKGLVLAAEGSNAVIEAPAGAIFNFSLHSVFVRDLAPDQSVVVRGLRMNYGVQALSCEGSVWFEELDVTGGYGTCTLGFGDGGRVHFCDGGVTFARCSLVGETGPTMNSSPPIASAGLYVRETVAHVYDCSLLGGQGDSGSWGVQPGGPGLKTQVEATVMIAGCSIAGGPGGVHATDPCGQPSAQGGAGIYFQGTQGVIYAAASTAVGGVADLSLLCPGQTGNAGPAFGSLTGLGTVVPMVGYARHLSANSPVRGGETLTLDVEGQPGEIPLVLVSSRHEPLLLPNHSGSLLLGLPLEDVLVLPALGATGTTSLSLPVPNVGAGIEALNLYLQAVFLDPSPSVWLGAGTSVLLLDAGI